MSAPARLNDFLMPAPTSQFSTPLVVSPEGAATMLTRVSLTARGDGAFDEDWLQGLLFAHPALLPIEEIEPAFAGAVPLCREVGTAKGPLDLLLINENGLLTLVECKLWRNPEARREVVGQILDYAQAMSRWTYEELDAAVRRATREPGRSLWERVREPLGLEDEAVFIDRVARHLRESTFLLLIVGDGIRENTEQIGEYLKKYAGLSFTLGLVEQRIYTLPGKGGLLVQPRLLAKTVELGRVVVKVEGAGRIAEEAAAAEVEREPETPVARTLTEQVFIETVAGSSQLGGRLRDFFDAVKRAGLLLRPTERGKSLRVGTPGRDVNLLTLDTAGKVRNHGVAGAEGGMRYLEQLAALFPGARVHLASNGFHTRVVGSDGKPLGLEELLAQGEAVLRLMAEVAPRLDAAERPADEGVE